MIILIFVLITGIICGIYYNSVKKKLKKQEKEKFVNEYVSNYMDKWTKKQNELITQLESVQYQLELLESLDGYIDHTSTDEKDIKKALTLEKQYAALYQKERKLKAELEKL